ncbi:MAG: DUF4830 domain-containing protein [Oscillospiraceae bacterium]|nr:DUF4830 domain-containing protein [Oscillospiraceae bacterium]
MYRTARIKRKKYIPLIIIAVLAALLAVRCANVRSGSVKAENPADVISYLNSFGWEVETIPVSVKNVQIPAKFSEAYERYNDLQRYQGFDLSKYRTDIVENYTFRIMNHPASGDVFANVLVFKGRIIGGDICSFSLNGFMTSFDGTAMSSQV